MNKILVAEDDRSVRTVIVLVAQRLGFECVESDNGLEAITLAEAETPDLAIIDMHMPGIDGLEVVKALARRSPPIPVIAISAGTTETTIEDYAMLSRRMGATIFLRKPFSSSQLGEAIEASLKSERKPCGS